MTARALTTTRRSAEPWRQRLIRSLLYGRNVDRAAKARARVGLAILAFAVVYAVLAGRLVMFAVGADSHGARRTASQDAIATARPDIVDRNGEVLATDVKAPSLFGEPRRIIDKDEAIELLTAALPDLDEAEARTRLSSRKGFVWLKREITPKQQHNIHKLGIPGIGFLRENKRVYPTGALVAHLAGVEIRQGCGQKLDRLVLVDDAARLAEQARGLDVGREDRAVAVDDVGPRGRDHLLRGSTARAVGVGTDREHHEPAADQDVDRGKGDHREANARARLRGAVNVAPVEQAADQPLPPGLGRLLSWLGRGHSAHCLSSG